MRYIIFLSLLLLITSIYSPERAVAYAEKHWNNPNHDCTSENKACTPYAYYGTEHCNYPDQGFASNDGANFISQCILEGGETPLYRFGSNNCVKYHCGAIDVIYRLAMCLARDHRWKRYTKKITEEPPKNLNIGDYVVYHKDYYNDWKSIMGIVVEIKPKVKIIMNSPEVYHLDYDKVEGYDYLEWILYPGEDREVKKWEKPKLDF